MRRLLLLLAAAGVPVGDLTLESGAASAATNSDTAVPKGTTAGSCACKRGPRGPRGPKGAIGARGPAGPVGPAGPPGTGNSGGVGNGRLQSFSALVPANHTEAITVGSFTLRENAGNINDPSFCKVPTLANNSAFNGFGVVGPGTAWPGSSNLPAGGQQEDLSALTGGGGVGPDQANILFAATLINGSSEVTGIVGTDSVSGLNGCVTTGFMTGV